MAGNKKLNAPGTPHVGRKKGVVNKNKKFTLDFIKGILEGEADNIPMALKEVREEDAGKYLMVVEKFMNYILPKMQSVKLEDITAPEKKSISVQLHEAAEELKKK